MTTAPSRARRISDWIGFLVFAVWAAITSSKMPAVGILLAPTFLMEIFVALSFLIRDRPTAVRQSMRARLSAYGGSFLMLAFLQLSSRYFPDWFVPGFSPVALFGIALWIGGSIWTAYSVWHLRHAFSIEPEARRLITSGPYRVARHPIYSGYFAQYVGMLCAFPTVPLGLALFLWSLLMLDRMHHEEAVLAEAFPEYTDYRQRVGALGTIRVRHPRPVRA